MIYNLTCHAQQFNCLVKNIQTTKNIQHNVYYSLTRIEALSERKLFLVVKEISFFISH